MVHRRVSRHSKPYFCDRDAVSHGAWLTALVWLLYRFSFWFAYQGRHVADSMP